MASYAREYLPVTSHIVCNTWLQFLFFIKQILSEKKRSSLKQQLAYITPLVEDLKLRKEERLKQFEDIKAQIDKIAVEISGYGNLMNSMNSMNLEEHDLSLRKLTEYQSHLRDLQKEKVYCSLSDFVLSLMLKC